MNPRSSESYPLFELRQRHVQLGVRFMFRWLQSRRRRKVDSVSVPREAERDSGEEEHESSEEDSREVAPSGLTRVKTDKI
jgi:hypothetical protein